jgi:hypothetical protein
VALLMADWLDRARASSESLTHAAFRLEEDRVMMSCENFRRARKCFAITRVLGLMRTFWATTAGFQALAKHPPASVGAMAGLRWKVYPEGGAPSPRLPGIMAIASLLLGLLLSFAASAQPTEPGPARVSPPTKESLEAWRATMSRIPKPKEGCFKATFPKTEWQEVPCVTPPERPYPPARGPRSETVGDGDDWSAQVSGNIFSAVGSFFSVIGVTSESDPSGQSGFALQLNTNTFSTSSCSGAADPAACQGWQQFIYSNAGVVFMQYWLLGYGTCPKGWNTFGSDCWKNIPRGTAVPVQNITDLAQLSLTGTAVSGGSDTATLSAGNELFTTPSNPDSVLNLAQGWHAAEFNVFGDCCGTEAVFNVGTTIVVKTSVDDGISNLATCLHQGFTGETNDLILRDGCTQIGGRPPEILFTESNACLPLGSLCSSGETCCGLNNFCNNNFCIAAKGCDGRPPPIGSCRAAGGWRCCGGDGWECGVCR